MGWFSLPFQYMQGTKGVPLGTVGGTEESKKWSFHSSNHHPYLVNKAVQETCWGVKLAFYLKKKKKVTVYGRFVFNYLPQSRKTQQNMHKAKGCWTTPNVLKAGTFGKFTWQVIISFPHKRRSSLISSLLISCWLKNLEHEVYPAWHLPAIAITIYCFH